MQGEACDWEHGFWTEENRNKTMSLCGYVRIATATDAAAASRSFSFQVTTQEAFRVVMAQNDASQLYVTGSFLSRNRDYSGCSVTDEPRCPFKNPSTVKAQISNLHGNAR